MLEAYKACLRLILLRRNIVTGVGEYPILKEKLERDWYELRASLDDDQANEIFSKVVLEVWPSVRHALQQNRGK